MVQASIFFTCHKPTLKSTQNWMFCVKGKHFIFTLAEYFFNCFSKFASADEKRHMKVGSLPTSITNDTVDTILSVFGKGHLKSAQWVQFNHPDSWTLDYILQYAGHFMVTVDADESGFTRINEVNAFTDQIPVGWILLQWYAFNTISSWTSFIHL